MAWIETQKGEVINLDDADSMRVIVDSVGKKVKVVASVPYSQCTLAMIAYADDAQSGRQLDDAKEICRRVMLNIVGLASSAMVFRIEDIDSMIIKASDAIQQLKSIDKPKAEKKTAQVPESREQHLRHTPKIEIDKPKVAALRKAGWTIRNIADEMNVGYATIQRAIKEMEAEA